MKHKIVLVCGRENLSDDVQLHCQLVDFLESLEIQVIKEPFNGRHHIQAALTEKIRKYLRFFNLIRLILDPLLSLHHRFKSQLLVQWRIRKLKPLLQLLDWENTELYLIGRSAGAIVASKLAMTYPIKAIIALGYPFVHPNYGMQKYRVKHLSQMNKPMFIFQGNRDNYGNLEQICEISMSSCVQLIPLNTDHAFVLDEISWEAFTSQLAQIIS